MTMLFQIYLHFILIILYSFVFIFNYSYIIFFMYPLLPLIFFFLFPFSKQSCNCINMSHAMSIGAFVVLMVLLMLLFKAVSHIYGWMDQLNLKNVLTLSKHLILTLLLMPYYLQHMVSSICLFF